LVHAALNGTGVVYVLRDFAAPFIATGQLVPLLEQWMPPPSDGFFLYYPSRRQNLASLRAFIEFLIANLKKNNVDTQRNRQAEITLGETDEEREESKENKESKESEESEPGSDL
jgi:LysR substrate binding domain